jgi:hypothetical protein
MKAKSLFEAAQPLTPKAAKGNSLAGWSGEDKF